MLKRLDQIIDLCLIGFVSFVMFSISLTQVCVGVGTLAWLTRVQMSNSWSELVFPLGKVFLLFIGACILAVITSLEPVKSFVMLKKILLLATFFWSINVIKDRGQRDLLLKILLLSGVLASLYGISQAIFFGVSKATRVEGTMSVYMTFAGLLMLVSIMGLSRLIFYQKLEAWIALAVGLFIICLLLTLTRQAWLGLIVGMGFLVFLRKKIWLLVLPVIFSLVLIFSSGAVKERFWSIANFQDRTFLIRLQLWQGGWEIFKDYPLTGCGFKCVDKIYPQYPSQAEALKRYKGMHNNLIQIAVDTGLVGLISWLAIWLSYFYLLYCRSKSFIKSEDRWVFYGSAGATIGFFFGGLFEVNFYDSEVVMLLYFIMAMPLLKPIRESLTLLSDARESA